MEVKDTDVPNGMVRISWRASILSLFSELEIWRFHSIFLEFWLKLDCGVQLSECNCASG